MSVNYDSDNNDGNNIYDGNSIYDDIKVNVVDVNDDKNDYGSPLLLLTPT